VGVETTDRIEGALFGTLVSDSLCLGSHYEYDAHVIKNAYGGVIKEFMAPGEKMSGTTHGVGWGRRNYHPGMGKGDQTDYGLYNFLMLEYFAKRKGKADAPVDLKKLIPLWKKRVTSKDWGAWICTQTRQTLQQVQQGVPLSDIGGYSNAMAMRSAAVHGVYKDEEDVAAAARKLMFTHREQTALGGGEFFARVAHRIIHKDLNPRQAIEEVSNESPQWLQNMVKKGIEKYEEATDPTTPLYKEEFVDDLALTSMARLWDVGKSEPIKVGKASPTEGTLPGSIYIILKYMDDFEKAIAANAMIGGDNASRGVNVGLVLGAYHGASAIPVKFKKGLNRWKTCAKWLKKLPLLQGADGVEAKKVNQSRDL